MAIRLTEDRLRRVIRDELRLVEAEWQQRKARTALTPEQVEELVDAAGLNEAVNSAFERLSNTCGSEEEAGRALAAHLRSTADMVEQQRGGPWGTTAGAGR